METASAGFSPPYLEWPKSMVVPSGDPDVVQEAERLGRGVHEAAAARLAGLVLDEERDLRLVAPASPNVSTRYFTSGVVALERELVAVPSGSR